MVLKIYHTLIKFSREERQVAVSEFNTMNYSKTIKLCKIDAPKESAKKLLSLKIKLDQFHAISRLSL